MNIFQTIGQHFGLKTRGVWSSFFGATSDAGEVVTADKAMSLSAVYRAVRLTAETVASLPVDVYSDTASGPQVERGGDTSNLIRVSPNADQTPMEFWEQIMGCQELLGEGAARKHKDFSGKRVVALEVLDPRRLVDRENAQGTRWWWEYTDRRGNKIELEPDDVLHCPGFSMQGRRGISSIAVARNTLGLAIAANKTAGSLFKNGMRNSGFLQTGAVLQDPDRERLTKIMEQYMGTANAGGLMILEAGMTFQNLSMSAQDAELLLTRKFEIEEIGRWYGMPPILLGHAVDGQTMWGSGVDSIIQSWLTLGLNQRLRRTQQVIGKRLMSASERAAGLYVRFNADALLAVNSTARIGFITTAVQNSILTPDEGRALLERGTMPGGNQLLAQVNLVPLAQLGDNQQQEQQVRSAIRTWLGIEDKPHAPALLPPAGL